MRTLAVLIFTLSTLSPAQERPDPTGALLFLHGADLVLTVGGLRHNVAWEVNPWLQREHQMYQAKLAVVALTLVYREIAPREHWDAVVFASNVIIAGVVTNNCIVVSMKF